jgi:aryl-alcohol dehydrogenase-like predicted oxidoreductase
MKLIPFGRTDLEISNLCLAATNFGRSTDERASHAILDTFCANGGNFVQAASSVNSLGTALSELHVGSWIKARDIMRDELVLATKLMIRPEVARSRADLGQYVRRCCEESLRRLRVEYLDLLLCDFRSSVLPVSALLEALTYLVDEGLVHHIGVSGMPAWRLREAHRAADAGALPRLEVVEDDYSLVARKPFETEVAAACRDTGAVFLARSPLAGGFLTDAADRAQGWVSVGDRMYLGVGDPDRRSARPGRRDLIEGFAHARGMTIAEAALAWVLVNPAVLAAVVGVTSPDELEPLIVAAGDTLSADDVARLADPVVNGVPSLAEPELAEANA